MNGSMLRALLRICSLMSVAMGHTVIVYPGWRGDNLITNQAYPFGMQLSYPCGGLGVTTNRTAWPLAGGAVAVQPGWFTGHETALMYINLGLGEQPQNYSNPMLPVFQITGPTNQPYPGTFCLPQVPLPAGVTVKSGDLASIQVVQAAKHGAALYSCADIVFTDDMSQVPEVNETNCFNTTDITVDGVQVVRESDLGSCSTVSARSTATATSQQPDVWGTGSATGRASLFGSTASSASQTAASATASASTSTSPSRGDAGALLVRSVLLASLALL